MLEHAPAAPRLDQKARVVVHDRPRVPECGRVGATPPGGRVVWCECECESLAFDKLNLYHLNHFFNNVYG